MIEYARKDIRYMVIIIQFKWTVQTIFSLTLNVTILGRSAALYASIIPCLVTPHLILYCHHHRHQTACQF